MLQKYFKHLLTTKNVRLHNYVHSTCHTSTLTHGIEDKSAVITGGAVGIGYEVANKFLENGLKLAVLLDVNQDRGKEACCNLNKKHGEKKCTFIKCDVREDLKLVFKQIVSRYKQIDILVNNAGILNESCPKNVIDINLTALVEWSFAFCNHMRMDKGGKGGTIINMSSIYGFRLDGFIPVYQATKFGIMGFTKSLGHSYNFEKTGVRVVSVNPGFTETELTDNFRTLPEVHDDFVAFTKTQPWQKVDAVGSAALEVFQRAESGTAWLIEGSKPITEIKDVKF